MQIDAILDVHANIEKETSWSNFVYICYPPVVCKPKVGEKNAVLLGEEEEVLSYIMHGGIDSIKIFGGRRGLRENSRGEKVNK